jgi:saccharopine dehydrogenase-like NADP-dependent oxidoreductase
MKGVVPPEKISADNELFASFSKELKKRGIKINEEKKIG